MRSPERGSGNAERGTDGPAPVRLFRVPTSAFRLSCVSICHTRADRLDCPVKYGAPVPPADLPHSCGAHCSADRVRGGGVGAGGAHGGPVGRSPGRVGGSRGRRARHGGPDRHDAAGAARAGGDAAAARAGVHRGDAVAPRRNLPALLCRRVRGDGGGAGGRGRIRGRAARRSSITPVVPADRRTGRVDAADSPPHAAPGRAALARGPRVRGAAAGVAGAGDRAGPGARQGARGRAAARVPRSGAARGARDQESADGDADRRGSGASLGLADGGGGGRSLRRDGPARPLGEGVRRVRPVARRSPQRSGLGGPAARPGEERGAARGPSDGPRQRRPMHDPRPVRPAAARLREPAPQRRRGDGGQRGNRRGRGAGRSGPAGHDRRPWSRHPGGAAAAGVRAVLHDQAGRHRPGARAGAADDRDPPRHDPGVRDDGRRGHVRHRAGDLMSPRILLVDDETNIRKMVGALLQSEGFETAEAANGTAAIAAVEREAPDAVLLDLMMPGGPDGLQTLEQLKRSAPDLPVVMMSGKANLTDAVRATKLGAFQFLEKPLTPEGVVTTLRAALELSRTLAENRRLHEALGHADPLVGVSPAMDQLRALIARVAPTEARVLITGESGTGKELVASAIHRQSARAAQRFVCVNSAAIPKDLVESEMFGHERGAFTGATERRVGRFELADGGTLFLDEVGDLSLEAQAKLLRVLETGVIERLGGERPVTVDVRVIAATNKDLAKAAQHGQFREDLLFRLNVLPLHILPLRKRSEDVPPLVQHFAASQSARLRRPLLLDAGAVQLLTAYAWPGNVRELANLIERLAILATGATITADDVARVVPQDGAPQPSGGTDDWADVALAGALDTFERTLIARALSAARGNVAEAARRLATDRANLYRRMRRLGLEPPRNVAG